MNSRTVDQLDDTSQPRYIARQSILERNGRNYAYELLYRKSSANAFTGNHEQATRTTLDGILLYGLQTLTNGQTAFIKCTLDDLTDGLVEVMPPSVTVLEVLEALNPTPDLVAKCTQMKSMGYRIALRDFRWAPQIEPLIQLADYIKVDFRKSDEAARRSMLPSLRDCSSRLLAEKVETRNEFEQACSEGFSLFQGYYFCEPQTLKKGNIPANIRIQLEILGSLQKEDLDFRQVAKMVAKDPAITYRILRMVNSAIFGIRGEINSIEAALAAIGLENLRRILCLAITASASTDQSQSALRLALARARFCELSSKLTSHDATEQYLLGLFSLLPAILEISMEDAVSAIAFRSTIVDALFGVCNDTALLLRWIEAYEKGDWSGCDENVGRLRVSGDSLQQYAVDAMIWADHLMLAIQ
jgi:EAL and modified HD-GYP domain-containing signal transduction protein